MTTGAVFYNDRLAGTLKKAAKEYIFRYDDAYFQDGTTPAFSLTLSKARQEYHSKVLFPFCYGLLAEGDNKEIQRRLLKIDEDDDFTRLLQTASYDTIGAITIKPLEP